MLYERVTNKINQTEMIYWTLVIDLLLAHLFTLFLFFDILQKKRTSTLIDFKINGGSFIQSFENKKNGDCKKGWMLNCIAEHKLVWIYPLLLANFFTRFKKYRFKMYGDDDDDEKQEFHVRVCQILLIIVFIISDKNVKHPIYQCYGRINF